MRNFVRAVVCAAFGVGLAGCERVVSITVPNAPERLVVEGRVERVNGRTSGRQVVVLTTTEPYFRNQAAPPARGAQVSITDGAGRSTVLRESATEFGHYVTDSLVATVGTQYTLRIHWQGDDYQSVDTLLAVAAIDSMYFQAPIGLGSSSESADGLRATIDMRDPARIANYYLWDMFVDGRQIAASDTTVRFRSIDSDQFYDGRRLRGVQPYAETPVRSGQRIMLRQQSLTAQVYRYYTALNDQVSGDGSPFSVPPNSLRGNVANLSRPTVPALGYFLATNVSEREGRVP